MRVLLIIALFLALVSGAKAESLQAYWSVYTVSDYGVDCTGVADSTTALQNTINTAPDHSTVLVPGYCKISLSSTISITGRVDLQILSLQHPLNCSAGSNQAPEFIWTGTNPGPMFNIIDSTAVNIEGFYITTATTNVLNTVINIDGTGSVGHQTPTLNMVQYNSFCFANQSNASFVAISISATSNVNNENYQIIENDIRCSSTSATLRATDGVTNGSATATSATSSFVSGDANTRVRISYASANYDPGVIDATIASVTNSTTIVLSAPNWSSSTTYSHGQLVTGSDSNLYTSIYDGNVNNNPVGGAAHKWLPMPSKTGATVTTGQSYGVGIYQAGSNSFAERYYGNKPQHCAMNYDLTNGSWSIMHIGGESSDIGIYIGNSHGMIQYYEDENDLQAIVIENSTGPVIVQEMRGTCSSSMANGWIYMPGNATLTVMGFDTESCTPPSNWVLYGFPGSIAKLTSINNRYDTTMTFTQVNLCGAAYTEYHNDTFQTQGTISGLCGTTGPPTSSGGPAGSIYLNSKVMTVN